MTCNYGPVGSKALNRQQLYFKRGVGSARRRRRMARVAARFARKLGPIPLKAGLYYGG